jgi:heptaprenyl diphosphate synthase
VVATDEELGKPAGQDLAEGIYTLPVLRALADPDTAPELRPLLGAPLDQPERDKARAIVAGSGAIADTVAAGHRYVEEAVEAAEAVTERSLGRSLEDVARSLLEGLPVSR